MTSMSATPGHTADERPAGSSNSHGRPACLPTMLLSRSGEAGFMARARSSHSLAISSWFLHHRTSQPRHEEEEPGLSQSDEIHAVVCVEAAKGWACLWGVYVRVEQQHAHVGDQLIHVWLVLQPAQEGLLRLLHHAHALQPPAAARHTQGHDEARPSERAARCRSR